MTRAFTPPDSLTKDDIATIASVRRDIWTNGMWGLALGSVGGYTLHGVARMIHTKITTTTTTAATTTTTTKLPYTRTTALMSVLLGGALGSFVWATTTGKNRVHQLHPIYGRGGDAEKQQQQQQQQQQQHMEFQKERQKNRLLRRETLAKHLQQQGHGLSDSHGGQWVEDKFEKE